MLFGGRRLDFNLNNGWDGGLRCCFHVCFVWSYDDGLL